jgi:YD repeat-containing protein
MVSAEGYVTEYYYNTEGQNYWSVEYPQAAYSLAGLAATAVISDASLDAWRNALDNTLSKIVYKAFDARGNLLQELTSGGSLSAWGNWSFDNGYTHSFLTYDQAGNLLSRYTATQNTETFIYDGLNRLVGSTDLNGGTTSIVFNDGATMTTVTAAAGAVSTSTYNKTGDLISQTTSGSYDNTATSTYKYDKLGRVRQATDATGFSSYFCV